MVDNLSTEALIERLQEESRSCTYPTDAFGVKKRYKDIALILFKEDLEDGSIRNYLTYGTRRSSSVSQYGNTPIIRRSRSSNGELTTVMEQVSSLHGRSTRSNYTLFEAGEKERETDSDDDVFHESKFNSDESFIIKENTEKDSLHTPDSTESLQRLQEIPPSSNVDTRSTTHLQNTASPTTDLQDQDKKKFQDSLDQQCKENISRDAVITHEEGKCESKVMSNDVEEKISEVLKESTTGDTKQFTIEVDKDRISPNSLNSFTQQPSDNLSSQLISDQDVRQKLVQNTIETIPFTSNEKVQRTKSTPEVDHEAVLRKFIEQPSQRSKSLCQEKKENKLYIPEISEKNQSHESFKFVELKIVESNDSISEQAARETCAPHIQKTLTTSDILHLTDDSDVVFIDAGSPSLSRTQISHESSSASVEEMLHDHESRASSSDKSGDTSDHSVITLQASKLDTVSNSSEITKEDIGIRRRQESRNSFRDLPIRSPTPPRSKPQRSPQTPRLREKTRYRHSSLAMAFDEESQELINGTRSASPTSKAADFRFFSFSLKKEKSKSATSLGSKRNRERVRLTSMKLYQDNPEAVNTELVSSQTEDSHLDSSRKRIGVRSMMIDGTIKRNFIVIHPSDDSDTIGLAPVSPQNALKQITSTTTPEPLSTIKTRITSPKTEKLELMKRISCQGELKEELSDIPENLRNESKESFRRSLSVSQISKSLRVKQNKKNLEHLPLKTSLSLSSEPVCSSPSNSKDLYKSPSSLSKVDCDSPTVPVQQINHTRDSRTVSKLCVVM